MRLSDIGVLFQSSQLLSQDTVIQGVSIDSRTIKPGELFVAIVGERFDGHNFVEQAFQQGACAAIVSHSVETQYSCPLIQVKDTQEALRQLAIWYRSSLDIPVLALTGSSGKTTTKEMLASILSECYRVFATPGNKNNHFGVPLSILQCSPAHEVAVFELGANHIGEIRSNVKLVKPHAALITNVGSAHIGEFGGVEAIFSAKSEIYEGLEPNGVAIYSQDDAFAGRWRKLLAGRKTLTFGLSSDADISAANIVYDELMCTTFELKTPKGTATVKLSLPGEHNVLNALAAAGLSSTLDIAPETIAKGLMQCKGVAGRLVFRKGFQGSQVLDDTYNANLKSIEAAMQVLAGFAGKRFLVLGDIGELGQWAEEHHRLIGTKANELGLDGLFTCGTLSQYANESFKQIINFHFSDLESLVDTLKKHLDPETIVVVKGSRSSHMENVVSKITIE